MRSGRSSPPRSSSTSTGFMATCGSRFAGSRSATGLRRRRNDPRVAHQAISPGRRRRAHLHDPHRAQFLNMGFNCHRAPCWLRYSMMSRARLIMDMSLSLIRLTVVNVIHVPGHELCQLQPGAASHASRESQPLAAAAGPLLATPSRPYWLLTVCAQATSQTRTVTKYVKKRNT